MISQRYFQQPAHKNNCRSSQKEGQLTKGSKISLVSSMLDSLNLQANRNDNRSQLNNAHIQLDRAEEPGCAAMTQGEPPWLTGG